MKINKKQLLAVLVLVILTVYLLSLDIKGLIKKSNNREDSVDKRQSVEINLVNLREIAKNSIGKKDLQFIMNIEREIKETSNKSKKSTFIKDIVKKLVSLNHPELAAFYEEQLALLENTYINWSTTGNLFLAASEQVKDSAYITPFLAKSEQAYLKAFEIDSTALEAKIGLGIVYVSSSNNPMQGIRLLLDVVKKDPENLKANKNLGLFSMRSGQFEKAVSRFKTVLKTTKDPESYFYIAESYKNLGYKKDAIIAYSKCKELIKDPIFIKEIDGFIKELQ